MLKNYFKIAFRNLSKYKLYTAINLIGLSVGLGISSLIFLFVQHENSFDDFHKNKDKIVRVLWETGENGNAEISASSPLAAPGLLKTKYEGILKATHYVGNSSLMKTEGNQSQDQQFFIVSPDFLDIFTFNVLHGSKNPLSNEANTKGIVMTEEAAEKYFGTADAVGKTLFIQLTSNFEPYEVKTVLSSLPSNSSLDFDILLHESNLKEIAGDDYEEEWHLTYGGSFLQLNDQVDISALEASFVTFLDQTVERDEEEEVYSLKLQPLQDIHLSTLVQTSLSISTNPKLLWILSGISILILLIACINFTTLSIGRSATRAKEVGVRKTMGAAYKQLFSQFMVESFIVTIISAAIGILLAKLILPVFNNLFNKSLIISFGASQIGIISLLLLTITFIAGAYPALFLSNLKPISVLKSSLNMNFGKQGLRKFLLGFQLFLSLFLLACTFIMYNQMKNIQDYNLGFTKDNIVMVEVPAVPDRSLVNMVKKSFKKANLYKQKIQNNAQVQEVAIGNATYGNNTWWEGGFPNKQGEMSYFKFNFVGPEYAHLIDLEFIKGRNFSLDIPSDSNAVIVNESFVKMMNMDNPLSSSIESSDPEGFKDVRIVGVIKDFHHAALYDKIDPLVIALNPMTIFSGIMSLNISGGSSPSVFVKSTTGNYEELIATLKEEWEVLYPEEPFTFTFLDEVVQRQYMADQQLGKMVGISSIIAILIAAMGLFALASLAITGRLKEIGIRKVMGASTLNISLLFNKEFLKITLIGILAAMPFSYYIMDQWLNQFAVKSSPGYLVFGLTIILGVLFTVVIVSVQTIKASLMNPIDTLKDE